MLLTSQRIQQAIKDARERKPGVILPIIEIYEAVAGMLTLTDNARQHLKGFLLAHTHALVPLLVAIPMLCWRLRR